MGDITKLFVGARLRDEDPRMLPGRTLTVTAILPNGVEAEDAMGKRRIYLLHRIHTDGKIRRGGLRLLSELSHAR
jgi:hypothetical protein